MKYITTEMLEEEKAVLLKDKDFYLECLSGKPLSERKTEIEDRDGGNTFLECL